jgi:hypothetical protein
VASCPLSSVHLLKCTFLYRLSLSLSPVLFLFLTLSKPGFPFSPHWPFYFLTKIFRLLWSLDFVVSYYWISPSFTTGFRPLSPMDFIFSEDQWNTLLVTKNKTFFLSFLGTFFTPSGCLVIWMLAFHINYCMEFPQFSWSCFMSPCMPVGGNALSIKPAQKPRPFRYVYCFHLHIMHIADMQVRT